jgi:hypothetical protein
MHCFNSKKTHAQWQTSDWHYKAVIYDIRIGVHKGEMLQGVE